MKVALVPIGNSKGIRIPRSIIEQCGFGDQVEMRVSEGTLVLAATGRPREH
jgi:antitoxin MazE